MNRYCAVIAPGEYIILKHAADIFEECVKKEDNPSTAFGIGSNTVLKGFALNLLRYLPKNFLILKRMVVYFL
jgi:hypothetical protein